MKTSQELNIIEPAVYMQIQQLSKKRGLYFIYIKGKK